MIGAACTVQSSTEQMDKYFKRLMMPQVWDHRCGAVYVVSVYLNFDYIFIFIPN